MAVDYTKEGRIAIFTLNRPEVLNAINADLSRELGEALKDFRDDPELWVGIITGAGERAFSAGADIRGFRPGPREVVGDAGERVRADQIWKPIIAAIHGYCLGGGLELALTCDIRIAADNARFGLPEIKVGVIPGGGGISRLPRFIPRAKAAEILLMGQHIDAQEAYRIGLVNKVVPRNELMPTAKQWANLICEAGPLQTRAVKEAMIRGYSMPLDESLKLERQMADRIRETEDFIEGPKAFREKRKPNWKGK
ncbi:MAG: enoyl-CoA hydratase-related protein [Dehalococcoidales bacterium]|nr:enoyl-CoA hydratase-related protein [Dehalococcoidales bacterium]